MYYRLSKYLSPEDMIIIKIKDIETPVIIKSINKFEKKLVFDCYYLNDKKIDIYLVSYFPDEYVKYVDDYRQILNNR